MKTLILILLSIALFFGFYFLLSCFGVIWTTYYSVISEPEWFVIYSITLGWSLTAAVIGDIDQHWKS